jgi:amphiphysin
VKKAIDKRDNKKLDFERFSKTVDNQKAKKNKTDR